MVLVDLKMQKNWNLNSNKMRKKAKYSSVNELVHIIEDMETGKILSCSKNIQSTRKWMNSNPEYLVFYLPEQLLKRKIKK